ncbi:MAG: RHS repeat-associated core domain-containing protein [Desulfobacterales bacterium]|nr:RHS repeat-associated core domain-containing protein [Desulfobacterales bacterium]
MRQSGQEYHYLYGGKGNVSAVIDSTQTVVTSYRYDSFGRLTTQSGTLDQPYRFSTKQYLADIGLNYYGYRFYSPAMGRWLNRDPLGEAGGLNLYAFIQNNPTNVVDPNGLNPAMCEFAADFTTGFLAPGPPPPTWGGAAGYAAREMVNGMGIDVDAVLDSLPDILADMWEAYYKQNFNPNWRFDYYGPYYPGAKYAPGEYYWESRDNYECRRNAENRVLLRAK